MSDHEMDYLGLSGATVATILVDDLDREHLRRELTGQGLPADVRGDRVETTLVRSTDDGTTVDLHVAVDTADSVLFVHSEDYVDAYGLAPIATALIKAIDAAESQSLFTYMVSFDHPLVGFETLVDQLVPMDEEPTRPEPGDRTGDADAVEVWTADPTRDPTSLGPSETTGKPAGSDRGDPPMPTTPKTASETEPDPDSVDQSPLIVSVDGDRFELSSDGSLLPVDDASRRSVDRFLAALNDRLRRSFPDPPRSLETGELPDGWAGPLLGRHPAVETVVDRWSSTTDGILESDSATAGPELAGEPTDLATTVLDLAVSLVYAIDRCTPATRRRYFDRYHDADESPFQLPIFTPDENPPDKDRFTGRALWDPGLRRAVADTRRAIRDLGPVVDSYEDVALERGQVWRHHGRTDHRVETVAVTGREIVGDRFVSLPVWVGDVRSIEACDHAATREPIHGHAPETTIGEDVAGDDSEPRPGDRVLTRIERGFDSDETVVIDGRNLLELVEPAGEP